MTELLNDTDTPSDAELISGVRGGDTAAYGELFSRHVEAANRLSRQLVRGPDGDDLVSEAFTKVLHVLQGGGGPDVAFRAYLLTAVRRLHVDKIRAGSKLQTSDDMSQFDPGVPFQDTTIDDFEHGAAAKAFASLPERWQLVLWHLEVEGQKPAEIAPLLGMSANSVSALAYRAREGLRQAFLTMHLSDISDNECRWVNEHLGAYVRKGLSKRDSARVESHLEECRRCTAMYLELIQVNSSLAGIIAPLLLGVAAAGYVASTGAVGTSGLLVLLDRAKDVVLANSSAATATAVAAGVAAVATAGILISQDGGQDVVAGADDSIAAPQTPGTSAPQETTSAPSQTRTNDTKSTPTAKGTTRALPTTTGPDNATTTRTATGPTTGPTSGASPQQGTPSDATTGGAPHSKPPSKSPSKPPPSKPPTKPPSQSPSPVVTLHLVASVQTHGHSGKADVRVAVTDAPPDVDVTLELTFSSNVAVEDLGPGCSAGDGTVTCVLADGNGSLLIGFRVRHRDKAIPETVNIDAEGSGGTPPTVYRGHTSVRIWPPTGRRHSGG